jgi:hypothetical protein
MAQISAAFSKNLYMTGVGDADLWQRRENTEPKKPTKCPCFKWLGVRRPSKSTLVIEVAEPAGELCRNPSCDKDPDSVYIYLSDFRQLTI